MQVEVNQKFLEDLEDVIDHTKDGSVSRKTKRLTGMKLEITKAKQAVKNGGLVTSRMGCRRVKSTSIK